MTQAGALLRKNFLLQTRSKRSRLGLGGWGSFVFELLTPAAFFLLLCIPKQYLKPIHTPLQAFPPLDLDVYNFPNDYFGPAAISGDGLAHILYAPNTSEVVGLTETLARALACPADYRRAFLGTKSFAGLFHLRHQPRQCANQATCMADPACWRPLHEASLRGFASEADALAYLAGHQELVDAMLVFDTHDADALDHSSSSLGSSSSSHSSTTASSRRGLAVSTAAQTSHTQHASGNPGPATLAICPQAPLTSTGLQTAGRDPNSASDTHSASMEPTPGGNGPADMERAHAMQERKASAGAGYARVPTQYTIRANSSGHEALPTTRQLMDPFSNPVLLPEYYKKYWFFVNLQLAVDRSILGHALAANASNIHSELQDSQAAGFPAADGSVTGSSKLLGTGDPHQGSNMTIAGAAAAAAADAERMLTEAEMGTGAVFAHEASRQLEEASAAARAFAAALGATGPSITYEPRPTPVGTSVPFAGTYTSSQSKDSDRARKQRPGVLPANVEVAFKPYPRPAGIFDLASAAAGGALNLLLGIAFLYPTRNIVAAVVQEKELRLREGMKIFGLQDVAYWSSWAATYFGQLAVSGVLCAIVCMYPFANSNFFLVLLLLWLITAALIAYAFFISTFFNAARVAGQVAVIVYIASVAPGLIVSELQPLGGRWWYVACLFPPACLNQFAFAIIRWESVQRGLTLETWRIPITPIYEFSTLSIILTLLLDIVIFSALTWYFDKVWPGEYGQPLPWHFVFHSSYWSSGKDAAGASPAEQQAVADQLQHHAGQGRSVAVAIAGLRKVFRTTDNAEKHAVDGLTLSMEKGHVTALLGKNGAGKTTTISILTGLLRPTAGDARINGRSVRTDMAAIRQDLGVCPQFDILWPMLTVREHLSFYAHIKTIPAAEHADTILRAAQDVGLEGKMEARSEELSGGQKRKLSVAIAFLADPAVVFLDEPTSGMDPYSRRFTWDVIRRHKEGRAIVLTTHSMEEADILADRIAVMADGQLAAAGTSLDLKSRFGVGYTLTVSMGDNGKSDKLASLVQDHIPDSKQGEATSSEVTFRLPREEASKFAEMLRAIDSKKTDLGVTGYGLSVTTMEEVFLRISEGDNPPPSSIPVENGSAPNGDVPAGSNAASESNAGSAMQPLLASEADHPSNRLHGWTLYLRQLRALFVKRALSARRDKWSVLLQLVIPILIVLVAIWTGKVSRLATDDPALSLSRATCMKGAPAAFAASNATRLNDTGLEAFMADYALGGLKETSQSKIWNLPFSNPLNGTLDGWLLNHWFEDLELNDALFLQSVGDNSSAPNVGDAVKYTLMVNTSGLHTLPAALQEANSALLRGISGGASAGLKVTNHPFPKTNELLRINNELGTQFLILGLIAASAILSSAYAIFLTREYASGSKHLQIVAGAPLTALWGATYLWDLISCAIILAGFVGCFYLFDLPAFRGMRMVAIICLLIAFSFSALPYTYVKTFGFQDEMAAYRANLATSLFPGLIGFLCTVIIDTILAVPFVQPRPSLRTFNFRLKFTLRAIVPHYCLARGLYDVTQTYGEPQGKPDTNPFAWGAAKQQLVWLGIQTIVYLLLTLAREAGLLSRLRVELRTAWNRVAARGHSAPDASEAGQRAAGSATEDEDVAEQRRAVQQNSIPGDLQMLLDQVSKTYYLGPAQPPVLAVDDVALAVQPGECFGLLGVNGAGKTTIFKMLTGELEPDRGEAFICGRSLTRAPSSARRRLGYCPQANALPGLLTGREVLHLYASLRGIPNAALASEATKLLECLGLTPYADRICSSYSGGNQRKLSVAVALVGSPPVILMDEPSTGCDPTAKRALWDLLRKDVLGAGQTVILTSHSMEECEALCTRLAIMATGRMRCLGSVQHLKSRFGQGYTLDVRVAEGQQDAVRNVVSDICPDAQSGQATVASLSFMIPQQQLDLPSVFARIEEQHAKGLMEEYALSQTTLENVFIALAEGNVSQQQSH